VAEYSVGDAPCLGGVIPVFLVRFLTDCVDIDDAFFLEILLDIEVQPPATRFAFEQPN
jgi:hypothetical protein